MIAHKFLMNSCLMLALGMTTMTANANTVSITTANNGTVSINTYKISQSTYGTEQNTYVHKVTATDANGKEYSSKGKTTVKKSYGPDVENASVSITSNHGSAVSEKNVSKITGGTYIELSKDSKSIEHYNSSGEPGMLEYHGSYFSATKNDNGTQIARTASNHLVGPNGNLLETSSATTITKVMDSATKVEHPGPQYVMINGQPVNHKKLVLAK